MNNLCSKIRSNFRVSKLTNVKNPILKSDDFNVSSSKSFSNSVNVNGNLKILKENQNSFENNCYYSEKLKIKDYGNISSRIDNSISSHLTTKTRIDSFKKDLRSMENYFNNYTETRKYKDEILVKTKKQKENTMKDKRNIIAATIINNKIKYLIKNNNNKNDNLYKNNYDKTVRKNHPNFPCIDDHYEDTSRYKEKNEEYFLSIGLEKLFGSKKLPTMSELGGLKPSEYATILGTGVKTDLCREINEMKVDDNRKIIWQNLINKLSDFEVGVLCLDTRPHDATGMKTNEGLSVEGFNLKDYEARYTQVLNSLFISHLYKKHSRLELSALLYKLGDYERDVLPTKPCEIVVYRKSDPGGLLKKKIDEARTGEKEVRFVTENIAYTTVISPESNCIRRDDPRSDESLLLNSYRGDYMFRIKVKPGTACFVDPFSISKSREVVIPAGTPMVIKNVTEQKNMPYKYEVVMETLAQ